MDPERFDSLAKRLGAPSSRRTALRTTAAGGLLSALGLARAVPEARAAERGTCTLAFTAQLRQGPSASQTLVPNGGGAGQVRGNLQFALDQSGKLTNATLTLLDGTAASVVGQATGYSLQVRIGLGRQQALVALGV